MVPRTENRTIQDLLMVLESEFNKSQVWIAHETRVAVGHINKVSKGKKKGSDLLFACLDKIIALEKLNREMASRTDQKSVVEELAEMKRRIHELEAAAAGKYPEQRGEHFQANEGEKVSSGSPGRDLAREMIDAGLTKYEQQAARKKRRSPPQSTPKPT